MFTQVKLLAFLHQLHNNPFPQNFRRFSSAPSREIAFRKNWGIDYCRQTQYSYQVIKSFRHRGLKALYDGKRPVRVSPSHIARLERIMTVLDQGSGPKDVDIPGFRLHPLKGAGKGRYAVSVSGNWRVTFRFEGGHVVELDYLDYH